MATEYKYSITTDFTNAPSVIASDLQQTIDADPIIVTNVDYINTDGDDVTIVFPSALDTNGVTQLNTIVSEYKYDPYIKGASNIVGAMVSNTSGADADYTTIASAFAAGETSVYVRNGIYYETSDIVVPSYGQLSGESPAGVIIVLLGGSKIKSDGSNGVIQTDGTISITFNTKAVTGTGTFFTNLVANDYILLGTNYYTIASIQSDTALTLLETYTGSTITNQACKASTMNTGVVINNIVIMGSSTCGLYLRSLRHSFVNSIVISKCASNMQIVDCADVSVNNIISYLGFTTGMIITRCSSISLVTVNLFNCASHGMVLTDNYNTSCVSCAAENNNGSGFNLIGESSSMLVNCITNYNTGNGVSSDTNTINTNISGCACAHNGGGIVMLGTNNITRGSIIHDNSGVAISAESHAVISSNQIINHTGNAISLSGDKNTISGNSICYVTGNGIDLSNSDSTVTGNCIHNCDGYGIIIDGDNHTISSNTINTPILDGIHLTATSDSNVVSSNFVKGGSATGIIIVSSATDNIVSANIAKNNTTANLTDNGTNTVVVNNITP